MIRVVHLSVNPMGNLGFATIAGSRYLFPGTPQWLVTGYTPDIADSGHFMPIAGETRHIDLNADFPTAFGKYILALDRRRTGSVKAIAMNPSSLGISKTSPS